MSKNPDTVDPKQVWLMRRVEEFATVRVYDTKSTILGKITFDDKTQKFLVSSPTDASCYSLFLLADVVMCYAREYPTIYLCT